MKCPQWVGFAGLDGQPCWPTEAASTSQGMGLTLCGLVHSLSFPMYYVFSFNKAFVPVALELGGRLKECVVIQSKVWAYTAELPLGEKSHFCQDRDSHNWQSYPVGPLRLESWGPFSSSLDLSSSSLSSVRGKEPAIRSFSEQAP